MKVQLLLDAKLKTCFGSMFLEKESMREASS